MTAEATTASARTATLRRLAADVTGLAALDRRTTTDGERASAALLEARLHEIGASDVSKSTFRTQASWTPAHLTHLAVALLAAARPGRAARLVAATAAVSYELDVSGRSHWLRRLLPGQLGTTVTARLDAAGPTERTLILVAHHDAAQTGILWRPGFVALNRQRSHRTGRTIPSHAMGLTAMVACALGSPRLRRGARAVLGLTGLLMLESWRSPTASGANDNATGVAAVLELAHRLKANPLPGTEVLLVFPGGEEVGNAGMKAWLSVHSKTIDRERSLLIDLDSLGSGGHLAVSAREGLTGWLPGRERRLVLDEAHAAGIDARAVTFPNVSDAIPAAHAGIPTVSILSYDKGWVSHLHQRTDTPDHVRWNTVLDAIEVTQRVADVWRPQAI